MLLELDALYEAYRLDPSKDHELFSACTEFALRQLSLHTGTLDRHDVAQQAVVAAFTSLPNFDSSRSFGFWFLGILKKKLDDAYRNHYQSLAWAHSLPTMQPSQENRQSFLYTRMIEAAGDDNQPLVDLALKGMTYREIANTLGMTETAVRKRFQQMKRRQSGSNAEKVN